MRLFKYFHQDRRSFLSDRLIRFTQPGAFNDPYEMQPFINSDHLVRDLEALYHENEDDILRSAYDKLSTEIRSELSFTTAKRIFRSNEGSLIKEINKGAPAFAAKGNEHFFQSKADKYIGVLCLAEKPDSLLMWAHYANNHEGFVVEFDCDHSFFQQGLGEDVIRTSLSKVVYSQNVPTTSLLDMKNFDFVLTKSYDWSYEQEWRMLLQNKDCKKTIPAEPHDICLFEIPAESMKRVILGCRADFELIQSAKKKLIGNNIELAQATIVRSHFGLEIRQVKF